VLNKCSASAQVMVLATSTGGKTATILVAITKLYVVLKLKNNIECYQNNPFAQIFELGSIVNLKSSQFCLSEVIGCKQTIH
jgi:hypothetical protein